MNLFRWKKKVAIAERVFVGTVKAECIIAEEGGHRDVSSFINLYEGEDGLREMEPVGNLDHYQSPASKLAKAQCMGWVYGGPLPPIHWPDESEDDDDHTAELIVFPGGKGDAA